MTEDHQTGTHHRDEDAQTEHRPPGEPPGQIGVLKMYLMTALLVLLLAPAVVPDMTRNLPFTLAAVVLVSGFGHLTVRRWSYD